jgi:membrane-bound lytic murein transglycosylase D
MKNTFFLAFSVLSISAMAAISEVKKDSISYTIAEDDAVLAMIDSAMTNRCYNAFAFCVDTVGDLSLDSVPPQIDSIMEFRLKELDAQSPFDLRYNEYSKAFINLYVYKKRKLSSSVLALAPQYFPMFEEVLDRYDMPLELKYLAVVESALNPSAKSRVGAQGLWQFMYATGKMYDLNVTSYTDDRTNPYKATVAACEFMTDLYKMYGDWSLVLAAYNSGPGNVNKAIRRSGGHKDYWKIREWLPRETRGYVPAFIAVNYMMAYHEEHNIYANNTQLYPYQTDTIEINKAISFSQLMNYIDISKEELEYLNPMYKLNFIPQSKNTQTLVLPVEKIGIYLVNEQAIYADIERKEYADSLAGKEKESVLPEMIVHRVRSGEFLGYIANKYRVSVRDLMAWNNLRSTRLNPGDKLNIYTKSSSAPSTQKQETKPAEPNTVPKKTGKYQVHVVRSGDTLWDIAKKYNNTSVNDLKRLNSNLNFKRLKPGMEVKLKEI